MTVWLSITEITSPPVVIAPSTGLLTDPSETRSLASQTQSRASSTVNTAPSITLPASHLIPAEASAGEETASMNTGSRTTDGLGGTESPDVQMAEDKGGLSTNMAAGIGVGSTLAGILILVLIGLYIHLRKGRASNSDHLGVCKRNQLHDREVELCTSLSRQHVQI